ncbi:hypothetical protein GCM10011344_28520 [Dokdonia pacifica]|uniref:Proprotein convertase P-domain-containing protein n=1 Tax=Dokdonia pacifica TaxID=1627892 RepID=A0A239CB15_9FLAO|nr:proprotein convertase P-domain-containing protein [Dokdonia pacifica]GGG26113.1 hypothetical protein GCM10011344_28520 [Dokdonia pacifica]SNS16634.1 Proprotein convertase P-domain-containing protein [Dokdonia pacifica]
MKLFKLFTSLLLVGVLFSCSDEEPIENTSAVEALDLVADLSTYTDSSLGMYKGVFTTADSQDRGTVEIKVINEDVAKASITYLNGVVEYFEGTIREQAGLAIGNEMSIAFYSNTRSSSFVFNVNDNGSNPTITDANSNSKASLITVVKENTRGAVVPLTGSFTTDDMSVTNASGTWSIIFNTGTGEGNDTDITTQTIFNTLDFGSTTGNEQSGCTASSGGGSTSCTVEGMYTSQGVDITWSGTHSYTTVSDCSTSSGTWSTANGLSGTFNTDLSCVFGCEGTLNTFAGVVVDADIFDNQTLTSTATSTSMGTIGVDADIDNVTVDLFHTFTGDLEMTLISPVGTMLDLTSDNGGSGESFTNTVFRDGAPNITTGSAPFTGEFQPEGGTFAATYDGEAIAGNWTLSIFDDAGGDTGTLNSWSIGFCDETIVDNFGSPVDQEDTNRSNEESGLTKIELKRLEKMKSLTQEEIELKRLKHKGLNN